jgi:hypothetical protein
MSTNKVIPPEMEERWRVSERVGNVENVERREEKSV